MQRRRSQRVRLPIRVKWRSGRLRGIATLADLSTHGARLEDSRTQPEKGAEIRIAVEVAPLPRIVVAGVVQRLTWDGFVVDFLEVDAELARLIADAAALVG